ncbi:hypothetical protein [Nocardia huaxiensis]|uniref:Uncharacterized protein n=1 Tax=Nocardia huaxiensis TaxID=2755382 RepID=A0A7D6ZDK2_9NOCA|nr:hypothetical protein [Nocardia huaxiensis]QLY32968.1 hypothetical protein H0264_12665 [Nocardia huaxiensis]UFS93271.1 hypothetical protein LPY97_20695 [Nocardia huaxiensis]
MKKFVVTAGLFAACAAASFAPASADLYQPYDPWVACKSAGNSDETCAQMAAGPNADQQSGFGWTGSSAVTR